MPTARSTGWGFPEEDPLQILNQLQTVFDCVKDRIAILNRNLDIVRMNDAARKILGVLPDAGLRNADLLHRIEFFYRTGHPLKQTCGRVHVLFGVSCCVTSRS